MPDRFSPDQLAGYAQAYTQPVPPPPAHEPLWPYAALLGGQGADIGTTLKVLSQPGHEEKNAMGLKGVMLTKAAMTPLLMYLMHQEAKRGNVKAQKILGTIGAIAGVIPAAMNARQIR